MFKLRKFEEALRECDTLIRTFATESQIHTLRGKIYYDMSKG